MIGFATIDAKNYAYSTVFIGELGDEKRPGNEVSYNLIQDAEEEYLRGLAALQAQIREKYESRIDAEAAGTAIGYDDPDPGDAVNQWSRSRRARLGPEQRFRDLYYT